MGFVKHGGAVGGRPSPEYRAWQDMLHRCYNSKDKRFHRYGGRGIWVCARWRASFANFLQDMGKRPDGYMLERKDNDSGYRPDNCCWSSTSEQAKNRSTTKLTWDQVRQIREFRYESSIDDLAALHGVSRSEISRVLAGKIWREA